MMRVLVAGLSLVALAACDSSQRLDPLYQGPAAPEGTHVLRDAVDGMIVGDRLMAAGEYELALRAYMRAAAREGIDPPLMIAMGSANLNLGRLGQAEQLLRSATQLAPEEPVAWNNLGVVLMEQGEYGEARSMFERAFALDSGRSDDIRDNLRTAMARMDQLLAIPQDDTPLADYDLERRGAGRYLLVDAY